MFLTLILIAFLRNIREDCYLFPEALVCCCKSAGMQGCNLQSSFCGCICCCCCSAEDKKKDNESIVNIAELFATSR